MSSYKFIRRERNKFLGGIAFYMTDQLPSLTMKTENPSDIEILTVEITIRKNKILVAGIYKPSKLSETDFTTKDHTFMTSNRWGEGGGSGKDGKNSDGSGCLQGERGRGPREIRCPQL